MPLTTETVTYFQYNLVLVSIPSQTIADGRRIIETVHLLDRKQNVRKELCFPVINWKGSRTTTQNIVYFQISGE